MNLFNAQNVNLSFKQQSKTMSYNFISNYTVICSVVQWIIKNML